MLARQAPNARELHAETLRKLKALHLYDVLRANKAPMAWGLEARFPFLDLDWLQLAYSLDPTCKMSSTHPDGKRIEKHILREAFDDQVWHVLHVWLVSHSWLVCTVGWFAQLVGWLVGWLV
jgi:asparagine synthetase B (glutamine-hydrolysing)